MKNLQHKSFQFDISEIKEEKRENGEKFGIIKGFLATFGNFDRGNDTFLLGAFTDSIAEHKRRNNRPIRMLFQHNRADIIGGFPINEVVQNEKGLFVSGEINLDVQKGREAYSLAKQGVITDMSIGFSIDEEEMTNDGKRIIKRATIWEGSLVDEPMNVEAQIEEVKSFSHQDISEIETKREFEKFLRDVGLSQREAKATASNFKEKQRDDVSNNERRDVAKEAKSEMVEPKQTVEGMTKTQFGRIEKLINSL